MIIELKNIYQKSPTWLRQCVSVIPFNYRLGRTYRRTLRFLRESDNWNRDQYREYQKSQLAILLEHAITTVPYYQRYRRLLGRDPFDMLRDIEPVTKQQMQENLDQFVMPNRLRRKWHITHTGGSSGVPLTIFLDNDVVEKEWAFMIAQWSRVGYQPGDKRVTFRDSDLLRDRSVPIVSNPVYNETLCSPFQLSDDSLAKYVELLRRMRPKFLRGYPSVLTVLAHFVEDNQITDLPPLAALLCASEGVTSAQRHIWSEYSARASIPGMGCPRKSCSRVNASNQATIIVSRNTASRRLSIVPVMSRRRWAVRERLSAPDFSIASCRSFATVSTITPPLSTTIAPPADDNINCSLPYGVTTHRTTLSANRDREFR